ncbi:hypothetical protein NKDENANG_02535 [Candidatus Entotheonellaceae bacterium PAL068K]
MAIDISTIESETSRFPTALKNGSLFPVPDRLRAIGDPGILDRRLLGFFCSARCPGDVILRTYEVALALREAGVPVIGGFHSPMEKECFDLLLRGKHPIVVCPARSIERMRIPMTWRPALEQKRLLIVSPCEARHRRSTTALAEQRNRFVVALASEVFVAHAGPGTKTERLCYELLGARTCVRVIDVPNHAKLIESGAVPIRPDQIRAIAKNFTAT